MKIEQLLVQHLYNTKKVTLHGIGIIHLNPAVALPTENEKDFTMPENAITFEYNLKTVEDEALVDFIAKQTGKIRSLAFADLDSFVILAKQFLNIGKPLTIEGVGTIQKNQRGDYEFIEGQFITPKIDDIPRQLREKRDETVSFESESRSNNDKGKLIIALVCILAIFAGLAIYYFVFAKKTNEVENKNIPVATAPIIDTPVIAKPDTTVAVVVPPPIVDSNNFKIVIKEFSAKEPAEKAFQKFTSYGHKLTLFTSDSVKYKLIMSFKNPLTDTLKVRDSLKKFFGGMPYVELK